LAGLRKEHGGTKLFTLTAHEYEADVHQALGQTTGAALHQMEKKEHVQWKHQGIHRFPVLQKLPFQTTAGIGTGTPAMPTTQGTQEIRVKRHLYPTSSNSCVPPKT